MKVKRAKQILENSKRKTEVLLKKKRKLEIQLFYMESAMNRYK